jgi:hypothetical protein
MVDYYTATKKNEFLLPVTDQAGDLGLQVEHKGGSCLLVKEATGDTTLEMGEWEPGRGLRSWARASEPWEALSEQGCPPLPQAQARESGKSPASLEESCI